MEEFVKVQISDVVQVSTPYGPAPALLLEDDRERALLIFVGGMEASSIVAALRNIQLPVLNTHDFMMKVLDKLSVKVKSGRVYDIQSNRFLAKIILKSGEREFEVEGRPSDIIALTVRAGADIYVAENVMERASIEKSALMRKSEEESVGKE